MSASGASDGRPRHQKPSFATLAVVGADFRNKIGTNRTNRAGLEMSVDGVSRKSGFRAVRTVYDLQQSFTSRGGERQGAAWLGIEASPDCDILHNCRSAEFTNGCGCPNTRDQAQAWRDRTVSMF